MIGNRLVAGLTVVALLLSGCSLSKGGSGQAQAVQISLATPQTPTSLPPPIPSNPPPPKAPNPNAPVVAQPEDSGPDAVSRLLEKAVEITLAARDISDREIILTEDERRRVIMAADEMILYDMPSPHGASYPWYVFRSRFADGSEFILEALDSDLVMAGSYWYENPAIWDLASRLVPLKEFPSEDLRHLFGASRVDLSGFGHERLVYDSAETDFRMATLVRILLEGEERTGTELKGENPVATVVFTVNGVHRTVQVYQDWFTYDGRAFYLKNVGPTMGSNVNAG